MNIKILNWCLNVFFSSLFDFLIFIIVLSANRRLITDLLCVNICECVRILKLNLFENNKVSLIVNQFLYFCYLFAYLPACLPAHFELNTQDSSLVVVIMRSLRVSMGLRCPVIKIKFSFIYFFFIYTQKKKRLTALGLISQTKAKETNYSIWGQLFGSATVREYSFVINSTNTT